MLGTHGQTKFTFAGTLPNGNESACVVSMWLDSERDAYRVLRSHSNLRSFRPVAGALAR